ncbi:TolB family protein [Streptomyces murinus]|uniref:TolB family protein n=1 Tax=Streptomyces murinus TaxID=33900 RepID=UPI00381BF5A4
MNSRTRRHLATLTSAASLAAGLLGAAAPGAQATPTAPDTSTGLLSLYGGTNGAETVNSDGTGLRSVPDITSANHALNWAPDGSKVVAAAGKVTTGRVTGATSLVTLPAATGTRSGAADEDPVYWQDGSAVVYSTGGQLVYGPSDGSWAPEPLLTSGQEPASAYDVHPTASPAGTLAFERRTTGGTNQGIWLYDPGNGTVTRIVDEGASPVFSADGSQLAFTRQVDGWSQVFVAGADGGDAKQITTDASDHLFPTWDPAGHRLAYEAHSTHAGASDDVQTVRLLDLRDGTTKEITGAGKGAKPAWQPLRQNYLARVYGTGPLTIDAAASRWTYDKTGAAHVPGLVTARSAVLVNKSNATYSAPGITLAAEKQGPLLMTSGSGLDSAAAAELKRTLPKGSTVYLNGPTKLLSSKVADQVTALGYKALRMDASDLSGLSARVAKQITATPSWIFLADGGEYHDPIAAATAAGALGYRGTGVVLLTNGKTVPSSVKSYINALNPKTTNLVTVGYNADQAVQHTAFTKSWSYWAIGGKAHEDVAANLARFWWTAPNSAVVEDTWTWQNAAAGGAATATYGPMLWSTEGTLSAQASTYLSQEAASVSVVETFGGNSSYLPANRTAIGNAIAASSAWTSTIWAAGGDVPAATARGVKAPALVAGGGEAPTGRPLPGTGTGTGTGTGPDRTHLPAPDGHTAAR